MSLINGYNCSPEEATNCSTCSQSLNSSYFNDILGPRRLQSNILIPITTIYVLMFLTGVIGNLAVCIVIIRNRSMHTATNYYLFSLAIADLLILLLGLPFELVGFWFMYPYLPGETFCKIRSYVSEWSSYASVLTIVAFSTERYLAICRPLYVWPYDDLPRTFTANSVSWILAGMAALPFLFFTKIYHADLSGELWTVNSTCPKIVESSQCSLINTTISGYYMPLFESSMVLFFLIPVGILLFLYVSMGIALHRAGVPGANSAGSIHGGHAARRDASKKQIIRMLAIVVISFFLCWAPFHAQRLGYIYFAKSSDPSQSNAISEAFEEISDDLMFISGIAYYLSSTINPILYNIMSAKYREAFRNTFFGLCFKRGLDSSRYDASRYNHGTTSHTMHTSHTMVSNNHHEKHKAPASTGKQNCPRVQFKSSPNMENGDEHVSITFPLTESLVPKSKSPHKVAFAITGTDHQEDVSQRRVNNESPDTVNCNDDSSMKPLLQDSGDPVSISEPDLFNAEMDQSSLKEGDLKFESMELQSISNVSNEQSSDDQKELPGVTFTNNAQDTVPQHNDNIGDKRDINIRQQEKTSSMVKTKLENKTLIKVKIFDSKNENKGDSPNDVTSRNNISAISIESLIDAHDVSYIDEEQEEVLSSIVAEPKKNSNAIHQNCQASFSDMDNQSLSYGTGSDQVRETQKCNGDIFRKDTSDDTLLDDEVHKFHEVVMKNQTSVTNFVELTRGSSGDSINGFQTDLNSLPALSNKRRKHLSSSTRHISKSHSQGKREHRRKSLETNIS